MPDVRKVLQKPAGRRRKTCRPGRPAGSRGIPTRGCPGRVRRGLRRGWLRRRLGRIPLPMRRGLRRGSRRLLRRPGRAHPRLRRLGRHLARHQGRRREAGPRRAGSRGLGRAGNRGLRRGGTRKRERAGSRGIRSLGRCRSRSRCGTLTPGSRSSRGLAAPHRAPATPPTDLARPRRDLGKPHRGLGRADRSGVRWSLRVGDRPSISRPRRCRAGVLSLGRAGIRARRIRWSVVGRGRAGRGGGVRRGGTRRLRTSSSISRRHSRTSSTSMGPGGGGCWGVRVRLTMVS
jgi:hypothetical protein